ncbi:prephenate dehydratase [Alicyclobacillus cycloheptanicus]|uniref:Prephenate dehydratase n=1 Tax=Alicyclobacillus cycloheptanicus TaxID=1457 RepID=A0ABT9XJP3_9BACL|nr:prephenate dehydratase [Alicyclobacillus cycloheptanicus]MDQ0190526.1 prephenate dehydratase [Alicyclobacillus cycloheptanicus]WDM01370.1 prephenate dehydratase [Alicyclobacillus cycloheptanicus]
MKLFYLGPETTFSHEAAMRFCDVLGLADAQLVTEETIPQVVMAVANRQADGEDVLGCIPLENTAQGSVTAAWDVIGRVARQPAEPDPVREAALRLQILASLTLPIEQFLITHPQTDLANIREVLSHPQALGQCTGWLQKHLPHARQTAVSSTAHAAQLVATAKDPGLAAIGTRLAAQRYGLSASPEPIQDVSGNETRFALFGNARTTKIQAEGKRTTLALMLVNVPNKPGGLLHALKPFYDHGFDLSRIESRPIGHQLGTYIFFVDVQWPFPARHARGVEAWRKVQSVLESDGIEIIRLGLFPELECGRKS